MQEHLQVACVDKTSLPSACLQRLLVKSCPVFAFTGRPSGLWKACSREKHL